MKYIITGDWHLRSTTPRYRQDDFTEAQFNKVKWILLQSKLYKATILNSGDLFDSPKVPYTLTNRYLKLFKKHPLPIIACVGNHDQRYHTSNINNTPFLTLITAGVLSINSTEHIQVCSWGDSIPKEWKEILLIHKCITEKTPPFFLEDAISADTMLKNYHRYKYIISGDYHVPHTTRKDDRWLINPGSIMRQNKDQQDHRPRVYLLDTEKNSVKPLYIPIKSSVKVFDHAKIEIEDTSDKKIMSTFISSIKIKANRPNFSKILQQVITEAKPKSEIKNIISQIMGATNG